MRVLAVYNMKGGVGKTATAVNLALLASREGQRTVLWDLDPQGAASFHMRIRPSVEGGAKALLSDRKAVRSALRGTDFENLDLLPADFSNRDLDIDLEEGAGDIGRTLKALRDDYDLAILDCAPNISRTAERIFDVADALIVPTIPTPLSLRTLSRLMKVLKRREARPRCLHFFSMVDRRKKLHRQVCEWSREQELGFLEPSIPYSSLIEQMGTRRNPLAAYAPSSEPAAAYEALWSAVKAAVVEEGRGRLPAKTLGRATENGALLGLARQRPGTGGAGPAAS